jgi:hypothetical protein
MNNVYDYYLVKGVSTVKQTVSLRWWGILNLVKHPNFVLTVPRKLSVCDWAIFSTEWTHLNFVATSRRKLTVCFTGGPIEKRRERMLDSPVLLNFKTIVDN